MKMKKIILTFMLSLFSIAAYAASSPSDLSTLLNSIKTMKADFTQTVYDNRGKAVQQLFGKMALQRPGKFRWDVVKPIPQLIVANQPRIWIYDSDLQQVTVRKLDTAAGETPVLLLSDVNPVLTKDYVVKSLPNKTSGSQWFSLTPNKPDSMYTAIQLGFIDKQISEMRLQDNLGHTTRIQFRNEVVNTNLAANLFTFKPPANVDVIDETRK